MFTEDEGEVIGDPDASIWRLLGALALIAALLLLDYLGAI